MSFKETVIGTIPSEWDIFSVDEISKVIDSLHQTPTYSDNGIPMVRVTDIKQNGLDLMNCLRVSDEIYELFTRNHTPRLGDIVISRVGTYGVFSYVKTSEKFCLGQNTAIISPNINSRYLFYNFIDKRSSHQINNIAVGSTQKTISLKNIKSLKIPVCSENEQKAIADTLSCIDDKIELNNRINKTLEEIAQAIFKSWFVDFEPFQDGEFEDSELGRIPKGWRVGTLDECIDFYNGYAFKSKELLNCEVQESYHVFKMGHIKKGGGLNPDGTKSWVEKSKCEGILKYVLKTGDLLMCMTDMKGNVALLGHTALMNESDKYIVNQRVGLLRANNNIGIHFPYLYILTNSYGFIENLRGRANSGVQVNLSTSEIKASILIIAPMEVNTQFNEMMIPMVGKMFEIVKENQTLAAIRDALLPKLMSGEVRVPIEGES